MKLGFVGLGKMGGNMTRRLLKAGHSVTAFDPAKEAREQIRRAGAGVVGSLSELAGKLTQPRIVWLMVPAGRVTGEVIETLDPLLDEGDIVIDGGNSFYKDSIARASSLKRRGISFLDCGTSGGIWGLKEGYCLMIGGEEKVFKKMKPLFRDLSPKDGFALVGPVGAGHFVKMIHNAVEYGLLEAYGEGFEILNAKREFNLDLGKISQLWNHGSVVRSWLLELLTNVFKADPTLDSVRGYVEDTGEGRWSVAGAIEDNVPAPAITISLLQRLRSRQDQSFSAKVIAALRGQFGGHEVKKAGQKMK